MRLRLQHLRADAKDVENDDSSREEKYYSNTDSSEDERKEEMKKSPIEKAFQVYDRDQDGEISFSDLRIDLELRQWITDRDTSGKGVVSLKDFSRVFSKEKTSGENKLRLPIQKTQMIRPVEQPSGKRLGGTRVNPEDGRAIRRVFATYEWINERDTTGLGTVSLQDFIAAYEKDPL